MTRIAAMITPVVIACRCASERRSRVVLTTWSSRPASTPRIACRYVVAAEYHCSASAVSVGAFWSAVMLSSSRLTASTAWPLTCASYAPSWLGVAADRNRCSAASRSASGRGELLPAARTGSGRRAGAGLRQPAVRGDAVEQRALLGQRLLQVTERGEAGDLVVQLGAVGALTPICRLMFSSVGDHRRVLAGDRVLGEQLPVQRLPQLRQAGELRPGRVDRGLRLGSRRRRAPRPRTGTPTARRPRCAAAPASAIGRWAAGRTGMLLPGRFAPASRCPRSYLRRS